MNGIKLLVLPELAWQAVFALLLVLNIFLFVKNAYPHYKKAFA